MTKPTYNQGKTGGGVDWVFAIILVPLMAVILGAAGALLAAMAVCLFTLDIDSLASGIFDLLAIVFLRGPVYAAGAAVVAGLATLFFSRKAVWIVSFYIGVAVFLGNALYGIIQASLVISPWATYIGGGLGGLAGIPLGISLTKEDRTPKGLRAAALKATRSKGTHPAEVEYWRADDDWDGFDD